MRKRWPYSSSEDSLSCFSAGADGAYPESVNVRGSGLRVGVDDDVWCRESRDMSVRAGDVRRECVHDRALVFRGYVHAHGARSGVATYPTPSMHPRQEAAA